MRLCKLKIASRGKVCSVLQVEMPALQAVRAPSRRKKQIQTWLVPCRNVAELCWMGKNHPTQLSNHLLGTTPHRTKKIPWKRCHSRNKPFSLMNAFCKITSFLLTFSVMAPPKESSCYSQNNWHMHNISYLL